MLSYTKWSETPECLWIILQFAAGWCLWNKQHCGNRVKLWHARRVNVKLQGGMEVKGPLAIYFCLISWSHPPDGVFVWSPYGPTIINQMMLALDAFGAQIPPAGIVHCWVCCVRSHAGFHVRAVSWGVSEFFSASQTLSLLFSVPEWVCPADNYLHQLI